MKDQFNDLLFELSEPDGFKLCFCVCDDRNELNGLIHDAIHILQKKRIDAIELSPNSGDLVQNCKSLMGSYQAILINLESLSDVSFDDEMHRLNFQRDALIDLQIPFSFWLSNTRLRRLATLAPDLWSRRTACYQFSSSAVDKLIKGLFTLPAGDAEEHNEDGIIFRTVNRLIAAEERLRRSNQNEIPSAPQDLEIQTVIDAVDNLVKGCNQGKSIEVALNLANLTNLDLIVRSMRSNNPLIPFESMYDVLLDVAPQMKKILLSYKEKLTSNFNDANKINLLNYFVQVARVRIIRAFRKNREGSNVIAERPDNLEDTETDMTIGMFGKSFESIENNLAAQKLVDWLRGNIKGNEVEYTFNSTEKMFLRSLAATGDLSEPVKNMNLSVSQIRKIINNLRKKVAEYLGVND